jgi:hypothetical protein
MGDAAKGINAFRKGLRDEADETPPSQRTISQDRDKDQVGH